MINKTEDVEGSRLHNTKGLVLWKSNGNKIICDFLEKDKCIRGRLLLVCDNKNSRILAIDSYESTNQITVAKIRRCERLAFLESDMMVLYVSNPSTIFKVNLQNNNVTELKGVSKEGIGFKGMCLSKDFLFYTYAWSNDKKLGGYVGRYKLHGKENKNFSKNIITKLDSSYHDCVWVDEPKPRIVILDRKGKIYSSDKKGNKLKERYSDIDKVVSGGRCMAHAMTWLYNSSKRRELVISCELHTSTTFLAFDVTTMGLFKMKDPKPFDLGNPCIEQTCSQNSTKMILKVKSDSDDKTIKWKVFEKINNAFLLKTERKMIHVVTTARDEKCLKSSGCYTIFIHGNKEHYSSELYWNDELLQSPKSRNKKYRRYIFGNC